MKIKVLIKDNDLKLFRNSKNYFNQFLSKFQDYLTNEFTLSKSKFFTYALFYEYTEEDGWDTYKKLERKLSTRISYYEDYFDPQNKTSLKRSPTNNVTELLGVAASLSIVSDFLGLSEADFKKIPETNKFKTLDYELEISACNGKEIILVESKGTTDSASLHKHYKSIKDKKKVQKGKKKGVKRHKIGIIFDASYKKNSESSITIVDPPEETEHTDPKFIQLLNRLNYYQSIIQHISKGKLNIALSNRLSELPIIKGNWNDLAENVLKGANGKPIGSNYIIGKKIQINDNITFFGRSYKIEKDRSLFIGLDREIVDLIIKQNFEGILGYKLKHQDIINNFFESKKDKQYFCLLNSGLLFYIIKNDFNAK
ncbi:hypothetical protein [Leptospira meyeri]|uniref:hypothetical protein n=1 Tax=Leptospira meyeri TaxID=29508 RepID=UPI00223D32B7|nr:hypothetical protein [Leptospira meyeri]MCW7490853.1 hypothetical protein [Leptospira meyeri]